MAERLGTLLVAVPGLSGTTYPAGTQVVVRGQGATVDAFVNGDWLSRRGGSSPRSRPPLAKPARPGDLTCCPGGTHIGLTFSGCGLRPGSPWPIGGRIA